MRSRRIASAATFAGRTFVVTGANSGIGFETARALVGRGAHVVLAVRDTVKGEQAVARLAGPGSTSVVEVDLSDLDMVARCAETLLGRHDHLSALICNAGVMGGPLLLTPQGFERQMATNHLGHAALVAALWPLLDASASRVVVVSSGEARRGVLALGRVAHRQHDMGATSDEGAGRFEADAAVRAGHDEGASGLLGQLPWMPCHAGSVRLCVVQSMYPAGDDPRI